MRTLLTFTLVISALTITFAAHADPTYWSIAPNGAHVVLDENENVIARGSPESLPRRDEDYTVIFDNGKFARVSGDKLSLGSESLTRLEWSESFENLSGSSHFDGQLYASLPYRALVGCLTIYAGASLLENHLSIVPCAALALGAGFTTAFAAPIVRVLKTVPVRVKSLFTRANTEEAEAVSESDVEDADYMPDVAEPMPAVAQSSIDEPQTIVLWCGTENALMDDDVVLKLEEDLRARGYKVVVRKISDARDDDGPNAVYFYFNIVTTRWDMSLQQREQRYQVMAKGNCVWVLVRPYQNRLLQADVLRSGINFCQEPSDKHLLQITCREATDLEKSEHEKRGSSIKFFSKVLCEPESVLAQIEKIMEQKKNCQARK